MKFVDELPPRPNGGRAWQSEVTELAAAPGKWALVIEGADGDVIRRARMQFNSAGHRLGVRVSCTQRQREDGLFDLYAQVKESA